MKLKKEQVFYFIPFFIAFSRIVHHFYTGYMLPDEGNYASMSIIWHETGDILFDQGRELYQYFLLFCSSVFGLNTISKMIGFMSLLSSCLVSCSFYLCNQILAKLYPEFKERWFILLLFCFSPMFIILIGIGITEIISIFFVISSIYVYYFKKNSFLFGLLLGLAYNLREPLALILLFFFIEFIYNREWMNLIKYSFGFLPFFYFPYNILKVIRLKPSLITSIIRGITSADLQTVFRHPSPKSLKIFPSIPNFIINNLFCLTVAGIFSIGLVSSILIVLSCYRKKVNKWQILSIGLLCLTCIYISKYDAYSYDRLNRVGTIARLNIIGIFGILFLPNLLSSMKNIKRLALITVIVTGIFFIPFIGLVQNNLSKNTVNRLSLDYKAPWLMSKQVLTHYQKNNSLVLCEPINRIRFFKVENITYLPLPSNQTDVFKLIKNYDCVFLYLEINYYFGLIEKYDWLYHDLQAQTYPIKYENTEFLLVRMV